MEGGGRSEWKEEGEMGGRRREKWGEGGGRDGGKEEGEVNGRRRMIGKGVGYHKGGTNTIGRWRKIREVWYRAGYPNFGNPALTYSL